jgi:hypothetical protein
MRRSERWSALSLIALIAPALPLDAHAAPPMHGLFNTIYVNEPPKAAIEGVIAKPFDPVDLPAAIALQDGVAPSALGDSVTTEERPNRRPTPRFPAIHQGDGRNGRLR